MRWKSLVKDDGAHIYKSLKYYVFSKCLKKWEDGHSEGCDEYMRWKSLAKDKGGIYYPSHCSVMGTYWQY
jgi:hypothetical protein